MELSDNETLQKGSDIVPSFRYEPRCKVCRNQEWGPRVTEALLRGVPWAEIRAQYSKYFAKGLRDGTLSVHLSKHCDRESVIRARKLASAGARRAFFERLQTEGKELIDSAVAFDAIARNCFDDIMRKNEELDWLNEQIEFYGGERIFDIDILGDAQFPEAAAILNDPIELKMQGLDVGVNWEEPFSGRRERILNNMIHRRSQISKDKDSSMKSLIAALYKREQVLGGEPGKPQVNIQILQINSQSFLDAVMRILYNSISDTVLRNVLAKKIAGEMDSFFGPFLEEEVK